MPKVSVIIPVYNVEKYLGECLDSILGQTLKDIEVICVDDGSTDRSPELLVSYAKRDSRVKVLSQDNAGAGAARNRGLREATGEYVFFCDPDDWCDRKMLAKMMRRARKFNCDVVIAGVYRHDGLCGAPYASYPPKRIASMPESFAGRDAADILFLEARANSWNKLVRRSFLLEKGILFQEQLRENDLYFSCITVAEAERISVINDVFYHYRMGRPGSLQSNVRADGDPLLWLKAYAAVKARLCSDGLMPAFSLGLLRLLLGTGSRAMVKQATAAAIESHYSVYRDEVLPLLDECGNKADALSDFEKCVADTIRGSESPLPLASFLARYYQSRAVGRGTAGGIALLRRLALLRRRLSSFFHGGS